MSIETIEKGANKLSSGLVLRADGPSAGLTLSLWERSSRNL